MTDEPITRISIDDYHTSPRHRELADRIRAASGVDFAYDIVLVGDAWHIHHYLKNAEGKRYITPESRGGPDPVVANDVALFPAERVPA